MATAKPGFNATAWRLDNWHELGLGNLADNLMKIRWLKNAQEAAKTDEERAHWEQEMEKFDGIVESSFNTVYQDIQGRPPADREAFDEYRRVYVDFMRNSNMSAEDLLEKLAEICHKH